MIRMRLRLVLSYLHIVAFAIIVLVVLKIIVLSFQSANYVRHHHLSRHEYWSRVWDLILSWPVITGLVAWLLVLVINLVKKRWLQKASQQSGLGLLGTVLVCAISFVWCLDALVAVINPHAVGSSIERFLKLQTYGYFWKPAAFLIGAYLALYGARAESSCLNKIQGEGVDS